ncbi:MAG: GTPase/DUF3482 domain-containing protein [Pseudomonadota bacterium]
MSEQPANVPTFAVVGQPNKGKSSIVATLAEDAQIAIAATPRTTRRAERYVLTVDGEALYALVDTPGFQRARAALDWLEAEPVPSHERPARVADFVEAHAGDDRFIDECELLQPILEGAGILYVVDGAKPFGLEYEVEMQVLRWTGQPRMALINRIGEGDHVAEWRDALGQYFSIVREFNAVHADFDKRIALLDAFAALDERVSPRLARAVQVLQQDRQRRRERSAESITDLLSGALRASCSTRLSDEQDRDRLAAKLRNRLMNDLRDLEQQCRDQVQAHYQHQSLERAESQTSVGDGDLFTTDSWEIFGLSREQLLWTGAVSGAVAGGGVDLMLGGASLLMGAAIGAVVGSTGAWFAGDELAKVKVLGQTLGGRVLQVGPVSAVNFPWVLLGRAWIHHHLVEERNHARREALELTVADGTALMDQVPQALRREFVVLFKRLRNDDVRPALVEAVSKLLELEATVTD